MDQAPHGLRRAGDVGAVELAAVALLGQRLRARRALARRLDLPLGAGALGGVEHARHERDDVARAAHEHGVADADVAGADDLLVGERRARHRRPAHEHRLEHGDRRDLADLADVPEDVGEQRRLLLGRVLERQRAARAVGARAGRGVGVAVRQAQHRAVEVVVELVALGLDRGDHLLGGGRVVAVAHLRGVEAEGLQGGLEIGVGAVGGVEVEGEEAEVPPGDRLRVLGADRARGRAARVDQRLVGVLGVVRREGRAQHHELAADLDAALALDRVRDARGERAHERRDVVAGRAVAARDGPLEAAALVDEREREPVELGHDHHRLAGEAVEERGDLLGLRRLVERQHRPAVAHRRVQHRGRADPLERVRVGREVGMLGQQRPQLVLERVVVGVGDERLAAVVGVAQLREPRGELLDARSGVGTRAHRLKHLATVRRGPRSPGRLGRDHAPCGRPIAQRRPARVRTPRCGRARGLRPRKSAALHPAAGGGGCWGCGGARRANTQVRSAT